MIDLNFVPETLDWCQRHYVPPIKKFITCGEFGHPDTLLAHKVEELINELQSGRT